MSWPKRPADMDRTAEERCSLEEKKAIVAGLVTPINGGSNNLFDRFSFWFQLKKCIAWVLRYKSRLQCTVNKQKRGETLLVAPTGKIEPLDVSEIEDAERAIIKATQSACFHDELTSLSSLQKVVKKSSGIFKLDPILRVGGHLRNSEIEPDAKQPILLPKDNHVSHLIICHYHHVSGHSGIEHTLSLLRQKYWITQARASVRRFLSSCFDCQRRQALLCQQKMASLPPDRVNPSELPFSYVGVDIFGPLEVHRGRSLVKRYSFLFTCLSICAIHIEIMHSLDTDSFINALR